MNTLLLGIPVFLFVFGINIVYAEPLSEIDITVLEHRENSATVEIIWNHDKNVSKYEIGCVSCMPNTSEFIFTDSVIMNDVVSFPNTSNAMMYLIAYDSNDEIVNVKQILVDITK